MERIRCTLANSKPRPGKNCQDLARDLGVHGTSTMRKQDLIYRLLQAQTEQQGNIFGGGVLEIVEEGFGFLRGRALPARARRRLRLADRRSAASACAPATASPARCARRRTTRSTTACCASKRSTASTRRSRKRRPYFDTLTPIFPNEMINLETAPDILSHAPDQPGRADRPRPARPDRLAAQGRQDDAAQADRQRHHDQLPRRPPDGRADRRAARRSDRHEALGRRRGRSPRPSTSRSRTTPTSPRWRWSAPSGWSRAAATS